MRNASSLGGEFCAAGPLVPLVEIASLAEDLARTELNLTDGDVVVIATLRHVSALQSHALPPKIVFDPKGVDVCIRFASGVPVSSVIPCNNIREANGSVGVDIAVDCAQPRSTVKFTYPQPRNLDSGDLVAVTFDVWLDLEGNDLRQVASGCFPRVTDRLSRVGLLVKGKVHTRCRPFQPSTRE